MADGYGFFDTSIEQWFDLDNYQWFPVVVTTASGYFFTVTSKNIDYSYDVEYTSYYFEVKNEVYSFITKSANRR